MYVENVGAGAQGNNDPHSPSLSLRLRASPLEEFFQIPRHNAPSLHVGHSLVDGVFKCPELLGLRQQVVGCRFLHFLRQQLKRFYGFFDG